MQQWSPAVEFGAIKSVAAPALSMGQNGQKHTKSVPQAALYPSWLLPSPKRLLVQQGQPQYQGALELLTGPHRLEAGWLEAADCALRDYFVARSTHAGLLWVYRERLAGSGGQSSAHWYLHGLFA